MPQLKASILTVSLTILLTLDALSASTRAQAPTQPAATTTAPAAGERRFSVKDYGALGDARTRDTRAIQTTIDAAAAAGGATVHFPPGQYLSGGLFLKNGVTLRLDTGATLLASTQVGDYRQVTPAFRSYTNSTGPVASLIYAEGLHDIAITGAGTINGQGAAFPHGPGRVRPRLLTFVTCRAVRVEGITLRNSPGWVQHYLACDDLAIRGIRVFSHANYNNDMMDVDCCRNVLIRDCIGDTGDDAITLKSTADRPCENVTIANCVISSHCNALKLGTESNGGFKNIAISNCCIHPSASDEIRHGVKGGIAGIALEIVDGGTLDGVSISNVAISGVKSPLFLRLGNRARPFTAGGPKPGMGAFRNVVISNITATDVSDLGCAIAGLPGHPIENVTLRDIAITFAGGGTKDHASAPVPEKPEAYPECTMFGILPVYGFYCRHVAGLTLRNVNVRWAKPDLRPALVCDDVRNLNVDGLKTQSAPQVAPAIVLNDVREATIQGCVAPRSCNVFLRLQGRSERITATNNDLTAASQPFEFAPETPKTVLHETANHKQTPSATEGYTPKGRHEPAPSASEGSAP